MVLNLFRQLGCFCFFQEASQVAESLQLSFLQSEQNSQLLRLTLTGRGLANQLKELPEASLSYLPFSLGSFHEHNVVQQHVSR